MQPCLQKDATAVWRIATCLQISRFINVLKRQKTSVRLVAFRTAGSLTQKRKSVQSWSILLIKRNSNKLNIFSIVKKRICYPHPHIIYKELINKSLSWWSAISSYYIRSFHTQSTPFSTVSVIRVNALKCAVWLALYFLQISGICSSAL